MGGQARGGGLSPRPAARRVKAGEGVGPAAPAAPSRAAPQGAREGPRGGRAPPHSPSLARLLTVWRRSGPEGLRRRPLCSREEPPPAPPVPLPPRQRRGSRPLPAPPRRADARGGTAPPGTAPPRGPPSPRPPARPGPGHLPSAAAPPLTGGGGAGPGGDGRPLFPAFSPHPHRPLARCRGVMGGGGGGFPGTGDPPPRRGEGAPRPVCEPGRPGPARPGTHLGLPPTAWEPAVGKAGWWSEGSSRSLW